MSSRALSTVAAYACRRPITCRAIHTSVVRCSAAAAQTSEPLPEPPVDGQTKTYSSNINAIVDQIASMSLLEVVELNQALKTRLNLPDMPSMGAGMMMAMPAAAAAPTGPAEEAVPTQVDFTVILQGLADDSKKIALIKEVKKLVPGLNLVQAKKLVEDLPQNIKDAIPEKEAEEVKKQLEAAGGKVEIK